MPGPPPPVERTDPDVADEIVGTVRRFVEREVLPVANDLEHADAYPAAIVAGMAAPAPLADTPPHAAGGPDHAGECPAAVGAGMAELGLFGATIPEAHGGRGLDVVTYTRIVEELSAGWMSLSGVVNTHLIAAGLLARHGTEEQRARLLPEIDRESGGEGQ